MKKICLILSIILLSSLSAFAITQTKEKKYSDALLIRLQVCLILNETTTDKDTQTTIIRNISGPENKTTLCRYKETVIDKDKNKTEYNCKFTIDQKNTLIKAMKADPYGESTALEEWSKYFNNADVCTKTQTDKKD